MAEWVLSEVVTTPTVYPGLLCSPNACTGCSHSHPEWPFSNLNDQAQGFEIINNAVEFFHLGFDPTHESFCLSAWLSLFAQQKLEYLHEPVLGVQCWACKWYGLAHIVGGVGGGSQCWGCYPEVAHQCWFTYPSRECRGFCRANTGGFIKD